PRRPHWRTGRHCTNIPTGPLHGGGSQKLEDQVVFIEREERVKQYLLREIGFHLQQIKSLVGSGVDLPHAMLELSSVVDLKLARRKLDIMTLEDELEKIWEIKMRMRGQWPIDWAGWQFELYMAQKGETLLQMPDSQDT
ncbi:hypothetical protein ILT44_26910, partial [Microvirga sp. BT689]|uniref:hypothetical protein n=1 Tax=Microvirga arvi TaxID=2778731 RepID=UPI001950D8E1